MENWKEKNVLVVGTGKSGMAALKALIKLGAKVAIQDSKNLEEMDSEKKEYFESNNIETHFGTTNFEIDNFNLLVLSPGVPLTVPFVAEAISKNIPVIGELELAYQITDGNFVGITGTNGKTTTTTLVGEIFKLGKPDVRIVGNIGNPVVTEALESNEETWLVTEISSFQLETISAFAPKVSAILNLTEDHMDRHKTMENYGLTKARIAENQNENDFMVINKDDEECFKLSGNTKAKVVPFSRKEELEFGAFVKDGKILIRTESEIIEFCKVDQLLIPGSHNLENALAAAAITYFAGVDVESIKKGLTTFSGVEHRVELCGEINGVKFVNDSKGTNPDATMKAIEAMKENIILILGGYDKNASFDQLFQSFEGRVKAVFIIGQTGDKIAATAEKFDFANIYRLNSIGECVERGLEIGVDGDTVLLSPACASWGMYNNFEERGADFKEWVKKLNEKYKN